MKKLYFIILTIFFSYNLSSQENNTIYIEGKIYDVKGNIPLMNAFLINLNTFKGNVTNDRGIFTLWVSVGDTVLVSKLGYQKEKVPITEKFLKNSRDLKIYMKSKNYDLDEVVIKPHNLTGVLDVDLKIVEVRRSPAVIKLKGVKTTDEVSKEKYIPKKSLKNLLSGNVLAFMDSYTDKSKQVRTIRRLEKKDRSIKDLIRHKNDREIIVEILGIDKEDIEKILIECGYPPKFVIKGNDLELLNALEDCYSTKKTE